MTTYDPARPRPARPKRYVRVTRELRSLGYDGNGAYRTRPWTRYRCICGVTGGKYNHTEALQRADQHARRCQTVAVAMERDRLTADVAHLRADRHSLRTDNARLTRELEDARQMLWAALGAVGDQTERQETA